MRKSISLALAKEMARCSAPATQDHGRFELIKFLATGKGDAEALGILFEGRQDFCRAVATEFAERILPDLGTIIQPFTPASTYKPGSGQLVLVYGGMSYTFHHCRPVLKLKRPVRDESPDANFRDSDDVRNYESVIARESQSRAA